MGRGRPALAQVRGTHRVRNAALHLGEGLWQEPLVLSLGLRAVGRGIKGAGPGQSSGQRLPRLQGGGGRGDGARKGPAERRAAGAGRWRRGPGEGRVLTPLPAAPSRLAPAEAGRGPQGVLRARKLSATSVLYYDSSNVILRKHTRHGGPRLRLPLRPHLHQPSAGAERRPQRRHSSGRDPPSAIPAQAGAAAGPLPTSCQGLVSPGPPLPDVW